MVSLPLGSSTVAASALYVAEPYRCMAASRLRGSPVGTTSGWRQLYKNRSSRKIDSQRIFSRVGLQECRIRFYKRYIKHTGRSDRGSKWSLDLVILSNF